MNLIDVTEVRFGRLLVVADAERRNGRRRVLCRCDCGTELSVDPRYLRIGMTRSCGCFQRDRVSEVVTAANTTHGKSKTREYSCWLHIRRRCLNPSHKNFRRHGGRGIKIAPAWRDSFEAFFQDMGPSPSARHSVDRINNNGDYEPGNCRWATQKEQTRNTCRSRIIETKWGPLSCVEAAERGSVSSSLIHNRLNRMGWCGYCASGIQPGGGSCPHKHKPSRSPATSESQR